MSNGYKPVTIREEIYNSLDGMKTKTNRSFSDVIGDLIEENKRLTEERDNLVKENKILTGEIEEKGRGLLHMLKGR